MNTLASKTWVFLLQLIIVLLKRLPIYRPLSYPLRPNIYKLLNFKDLACPVYLSLPQQTINPLMEGPLYGSPL